MTPTPPTSYSWMSGPVGEHDWPEDFQHENGNYVNRCCQCGKGFYGYKRRVVCKLCANKPDPAPTPQPASEVERTECFCGKPPVCYCDHGSVLGYGCDDCCGHDDGDGKCQPVADAHAALLIENKRLKHEWSVMARACGNWRDFGQKLTPEAVERRKLIEDSDFEVAARAIVERDHLVNSRAALVEALEAAEAKNAKLLELLAEARDMVQCWGEQNDEYFQQKWDFKGDIAKLDAALLARGE